MAPCRCEQDRFTRFILVVPRAHEDGFSDDYEAEGRVRTVTLAFDSGISMKGLRTSADYLPSSQAHPTHHQDA